MKIDTSEFQDGDQLLDENLQTVYTVTDIRKKQPHRTIAVVRFRDGGEELREIPHGHEVTVRRAVYAGPGSAYDGGVEDRTE